MKKGLVILSVIMLIIISFLSYGLINDFIIKPYVIYDNEIWLNGDYKEKRTIEYDSISNVIPEPTSISGYENYSFYLCCYRNTIFRYTFETGCFSNNLCLEVTYSNENYKKAEEEVYKNYDFIENAIDEYIPVSETYIGNFKIKFILNQSLDYINEDETLFVAFNGKNKIRFCYQSRGTSMERLKDENQCKLFIQKGFLMDW